MKVKPVCDCCGKEYVVARKGGGFRCESCKTIWDDHGQLVGPQNTQNIIKLNSNEIFTLRSSAPNSYMLAYGEKIS
jgi:ribosomal protein L37AE/L43A